MKSKKNFFIKAGIIVFLCTAFVGCSDTNLFKELGLTTISTENSSEAFESYLEQGDYTAAVDLATGIIDNPDSTEAELQAAYLARAEATMGEAGVTLMSVATNLMSLSSDEDADTENIFSSLGLDDASQAELSLAATDFNAAAAAGVPLTQDQQLTRGIANTVAAVKVIDGVFEIDETNGVTKKDVTQSYADILGTLKNPDDNEDTDDSFSILTSSAIEGLTGSNSLTDDQVTEVSDVDEAAQDVDDLSEDSTDEELQAAFESIFGSF